MGKPWTPAEDSRLRKLYRDTSIRECADILNRTYNSVQSRARELDLRSVVRRTNGKKLFINRVDRDWRRLLKDIPEDTRTEGQKLLGEPIFERSALYKKQMEAR